MSYITLNLHIDYQMNTWHLSALTVNWLPTRISCRDEITFYFRVKISRVENFKYDMLLRYHTVNVIDNLLKKKLLSKLSYKSLILYLYSKSSSLSVVEYNTPFLLHTLRFITLNSIGFVIEVRVIILRRGRSFSASFAHLLPFPHLLNHHGSWNINTFIGF